MTRPLAQPALRGAVLGLCPRCGAPGLFGKLIAFRDRCHRCGLDFAAFDVGDAAAPFLIFAVGAVIMIGAIWLELSRSPPWWVHALVWPPVTILLTVALLRVVKGVFLALEYKNDARLGQHD